MSDHDWDKACKDLVAAAHKVAAYGLVRCSSGNLSLRLDENRMLVTGTQTWMADITAHQIAECRLEDGAQLGAVRPSVESRFHAGILRTRKDMNVVLHFQSPNATTLACCNPTRIDFNVILEIPYYIGPVATVDFLAPGSPDLAQAVVEQMKGHDMLILRNHGQVTVGKDFNDAIQKAAFFELACGIILNGGKEVEAMSHDAVADLRRKASRPDAGAA